MGYRYAGKDRLEWKDPSMHPYYSMIAERLLGNFSQNWLAVYTGPTGSGKSYGALRTCEQYYKGFMDTTFYKVMDTNVAFSASDFIKKVQDGHFQKGELIIWDEAGVGVNSRQWYTISNKAVLYVLQTFRHLNLGVIFTTPTFGYLDAGIRPLFHTLLSFTGSFARIRVGPKIKYASVARLHKIVVDRYEGKIWYGNYHARVGNEDVLMPYIYFFKPRSIVVRKYEKMKQEFSASLRKELNDAIEMLEKAKTKKDPKQIVNELLANADRYFYVDKKGKMRADIGRIVIDFKLNDTTARNLANTAIRIGLGDVSSK
jgi:hypothetical protein